MKLTNTTEDNMNSKNLIATIAALTACASTLAQPGLEYFGNQAPEATATRTIVIKPDTKYVNVNAKETVKFQIGERSYTWKFGDNFPSFELGRAFPADVLNQRVVAYVELPI